MAGDFPRLTYLQRGLDMFIKNTKDLKDALRNGKYAWPGGYPMFFIADDGEALSFDAVYLELKQVLRAIKTQERFSNWRVIGVDVNWEDENLYCAHTGEKIESAYGED
jgi:hypothetical protein